MPFNIVLASFRIDFTKDTIRKMDGREDIVRGEKNKMALSS